MRVRLRLCKPCRRWSHLARRALYSYERTAATYPPPGLRLAKRPSTRPESAPRISIRRVDSENLSEIALRLDDYDSLQNGQTESDPSRAILINPTAESCSEE